MSLICKDSNELEKDLLRKEVTRKGIDYGETGVEFFFWGASKKKDRGSGENGMEWGCVVLGRERWVVVVGHM